MSTIKIIYVVTTEVAPDAFAVDAKASATGTWYRHKGPKDFAYFTQAEADKLERAVWAAMQINTDHWDSGRGGYYGTDAYEYEQLEREYYES